MTHTGLYIIHRNICANSQLGMAQHIVNTLNA